MIVNASPSSEHASETANSLTFGSRCKRVKSSSGGEMAAQLKDLRKVRWDEGDGRRARLPQGGGVAAAEGASAAAGIIGACLV